MKALEITVAAPFAEAEEVMRGALAQHGFGVLTEIDVAATLKLKLGVDRPALKILGACNPQLAHQALLIDPSVSLVLPCNVVLESSGGSTRIAIADPASYSRTQPLKSSQIMPPRNSRPPWTQSP